MSDQSTSGESNGRIGVFDGFRSYALYGVVIMHLFGVSGVLAVGRNDAVSHAIWIVFGNTIDFFFVISGFLLFLPVLRRGHIKGGTRAFYIRRLARIQPEYWLTLIVVILMIVLIPVPFEPEVPSLGNFLIHVFDLQTAVRMLDPNFTVGFWINGSVWMIPVLVGLYIVFPPFSRLMMKRPLLALCLGLAVTIGWKFSVHHFTGFFSWLAGGEGTTEQRVIIAIEQSPSYAFSFAAGMFTAWLYQWFRKNPGTVWQTRALPVAGGLAVAGWIVCGITFANAAVTTTTGFDGSGIARSETLPNLVATASRATLMLYIALGPLLLKRVFDNRFASSGASLSYGLYLIHLPVAYYLGQLLDLPDDGTIEALLVWSALVFPLSLAWAWISSRLVGKPAIAWSEKRLTTRSN